MAGDYFPDFYLVKRPGTPYFLPTCPNPGACQLSTTRCM
jgi:hypothetical protein